ncbi:MAG: glycosyltransferase [Clostridia bacterium]|nr:glycosyltransferase [Clostridia bacterium]
MKKIAILMLHLQHGGIEKQTITLANNLASRYKVNIISVYSMNSAPAYPVDPQVEITYLIDDAPNRDGFRQALRDRYIFRLIREAVKAVRILYLKRRLMAKAIRRLDSDYVLSTRIDFAEQLSKYAPRNVVTLTQEHLHDDSDKYVAQLKRAFRNLDYLVVLCRGAMANHSVWQRDNAKIKLVEIPNILEGVPQATAELKGNNLVAVGRLHPVKAFDHLIRVFSKVAAQLSDATLTIVGGGDEQDRLEQLVRELNLEGRVKITGMVSKEQVEQYMLDSDLYVMTSHTECFPMVLLEASSVGLPLISFDVPVGPEAIITNDENGYLIENRDMDAMAETIVSLLQDRDRLKRLGANAKAQSYKYLPEEIMGKWYDLFR